MTTRPHHGNVASLSFISFIVEYFGEQGRGVWGNPVFDL
jgi:hypothetical protein